MFDRDAFERKKRETAQAQYADTELQRTALDVIVKSDEYGYGYQWTWLGLPIIQMPADIVATQEIIWATKPDVIVETGIAWGGSVLLYASILELIGTGRVIAVDRVLPESNREKITANRFSHRISLIEGSSTAPEIVSAVKEQIVPGDKVMVLLDSNHAHDHVLDELRLYGPLVGVGMYLIVSDTVVDDIPTQTHRPRPWGPGNNPKTALRQYLSETDCFEEDAYINAKLLITYTPNGYLRRVR